MDKAKLHSPFCKMLDLTEAMINSTAEVPNTDEILCSVHEVQRCMDWYRPVFYIEGSAFKFNEIETAIQQFKQAVFNWIKNYKPTFTIFRRNINREFYDVLLEWMQVFTFPIIFEPNY